MSGMERGMVKSQTLALIVTKGQIESVRLLVWFQLKYVCHECWDEAKRTRTQNTHSMSEGGRTRKRNIFIKYFDELQQRPRMGLFHLTRYIVGGCSLLMCTYVFYKYNRILCACDNQKKGIRTSCTRMLPFSSFWLGFSLHKFSTGTVFSCKENGGLGILLITRQHEMNILPSTEHFNYVLFNVAFWPFPGRL